MTDYSVALKNGQWRVRTLDDIENEVYADTVRLVNVNARLILLPKTDSNARQAGEIHIYDVATEVVDGELFIYGLD